MFRYGTVFSCKIRMRRSLTLIEVMVAVAIFSILSVSLFYLLRTGLFVRERIEQDQANVHNLYLNVEKVGRELRNIISFKNEETGFKGDAQHLEFYALVFDYVGEQSNVVCTEYGYKEKMLTKTLKDPLNAEVVKTFDVLENVENVTFYYFDSQAEEWKDSWENKKVLPHSIRISVMYTNSQGKSTTLDKYVSLYR